MNNQSRKEFFERKAKEAVFLQRLAELRARNAHFPWTASETPEFEIPKEESKLLADRAIEAADLSDAEIEYIALLDLTSLSFNFKTFYKRLHYEILRAARYKRELSLCLVAVDDLDKITKHFGADARAAVFEQAARILLSSIRDVDIAARCRDDCFGLILPETPLAGAEIAAVRLRTRMEELEIAGAKQPVRVTVSVGGGAFPTNGNSAAQLFGHAADALTLVSEQGGNAISFGS